LSIIYSMLGESSGVDEKKSKPKQFPKKNKPDITSKSPAKKPGAGNSSNQRFGKHGRKKEESRSTKGKPGGRSGRR
jgi:hypothetical protein